MVVYSSFDELFENQCSFFDLSVFNAVTFDNDMRSGYIRNTEDDLVCNVKATHMGKSFGNNTIKSQGGGFSVGVTFTLPFVDIADEVIKRFKAKNSGATTVRVRDDFYVVVQQMVGEFNKKTIDLQFQSVMEKLDDAVIEVTSTDQPSD